MGRRWISSSGIGLSTANIWTQPQTGPFYDNGGLVFNIKAFGAVGDGVTDDSAAIRAAVSAAGTAALSTSAGARVYGPHGTYLVRKNPSTPAYNMPCAIRLPTGVTFYGSGHYSTTIKLDANQNCSVFSNAQGDISLGGNSEYLGVYDLQINGNKANQTAWPTASLTAATASAGGSVDIGLHRYSYTWVGSYGESGLNFLTSAGVSVTTTSGNQTVTITGIPTTGAPAGTTRVNIYRTLLSSSSPTSPHFLVGFVSYGTTSFVDTVADSTLNVMAPGVHGIFFETTPLFPANRPTNDLSFDPHYHISNVFIQNTGQTGVWSNGRQSSSYYNVQAYTAGQFGFCVGSDTQMVNCVSGTADYEGYCIVSNTKISNCISFWSGAVGGATRGAGFLVYNSGSGAMLTGCFAQDNQGSGFSILSSNRCTVVGCIADSNSRLNAGSQAAVALWASNYNIVEANCYERNAYGTAYQTYALSSRSGSQFNTIRIKHSGYNGGSVNASAISTSTPTSYPNNEIHINAQDSIDAPTFATPYTPDPYGKGGIVLLTGVNSALTINAPINYSTLHIGLRLEFILEAASSGGPFTVTWNATYKGNMPTSLANNSVTRWVAIWDGTNWVG